jgi:hypothetical protein
MGIGFLTSRSRASIVRRGRQRCGCACEACAIGSPCPTPSSATASDGKTCTASAASTARERWCEVLARIVPRARSSRDGGPTTPDPAVQAGQHPLVLAARPTACVTGCNFLLCALARLPVHARALQCAAANPLSNRLQLCSLGRSVKIRIGSAGRSLAFPALDESVAKQPGSE